MVVVVPGDMFFAPFYVPVGLLMHIEIAHRAEADCVIKPRHYKVKGEVDNLQGIEGQDLSAHTRSKPVVVAIIAIFIFSAGAVMVGPVETEPTIFLFSEAV
jgi:hypothetical protein